MFLSRNIFRSCPSIYLFYNLSIPGSVHSFDCPLIHLPMLSFIHSITHSFVFSFFHPFIYKSVCFIHPHVNYLITNQHLSSQLSIYSSVHLFIHPPINIHAVSNLSISNCLFVYQGTKF